MQTGALIVAAGKSSRMVDFKPMLQLGSISIAQRVINNFRQAGISKVVVVTGYHADVLECHLASNNVVFLRNENYANTAPGREDSIILLKEFPSVVPYPLSRGSTTNLPNFLSSDNSVISILGLLKSNTIGFPPSGLIKV